MIMDKHRNSTIELLRIFCMILLIIHHICIHGGLIGSTTGVNKIIAISFLPIGKIAFCCFLAISMYFLTEQNFRAKKFVSTWMMVWFYSVTFALVAMFIQKDVPHRSLLASIFPIIGNAHGFAAAYLAFYLLLPILRVLTKKLSDIQVTYLFVLLVIFQCMTKILGSITDYYQNLESELTLFVLCYFFQLVIKRSKTSLVNSRILLILIILITYLLRISLEYVHPQHAFGVYIYKIIGSIVINESGILNILAGYSLFYLFIGFKSTNSRCINALATAAFPVLLIHDHNVLRGVIWSQIFKIQNYNASSHLLLVMIAIAIIIYLFGFAVEFFRKRLTDKLILNNSKLNDYLERIDNKLNA